MKITANIFHERIFILQNATKAIILRPDSEN
jgi:hypothetical protein